MLSAAASRPACSCSVASCINCAIRCVPGAAGSAGGTSGAGWPAAGTAPTGIAPTGISGTETSEAIAAAAVPGSVARSVKGITQAVDHRFEDRDRRLQLLQVVAIAVARAVVQFFGHLGIAGGARITAVLVEGQTALVEWLADEIEQAAGRSFLVVDDVFVADRQVA